VLLHIGPHKTGTTAIQGALFRARPELANHGVLHPGSTPQPRQAVLALRGVRPLPGDPIPRKEQWDSLVKEVSAAAGKRVIVSSEMLADADMDSARRVVKELGVSHVAVTLRPLTKILPSQWQTYVRNRATFTYDEWLEGMLRRPPYNKPTPSFWHRHHHDLLVERWASIVGPSNVTVIVADGSDRDALFRAFEDLLGLPSGLLVGDSDRANRSFTFGEIELVRQVNQAFDRIGWPHELHKKVVRNGFNLHWQVSRIPARDEPRITTPQWALDRAAEIGATAAEKISGLGVNIVGDISTLGTRVVAEEPPKSVPADAFVALDAAREAVVATILASGAVTAPPTVDETTSADLLRIVAERVRRRLTGRRRASPSPIPLATSPPDGVPSVQA
jgi:hypothetical protein